MNHSTFHNSSYLTSIELSNLQLTTATLMTSLHATNLANSLLGLSPHKASHIKTKLLPTCFVTKEAMLSPVV